MFKSVRYLFLVFVTTVSLVFGNVTPVYAAFLPAEINKQFSPLQIDAGGVSVMRVTIFNPNTFELTNASWADNLVSVQPGLYIASPAGVVNTCGAVGDVTAVPGTTNLALSNGTVPPQVTTPGECYVEVNVSSVTAGNLINTIPTGNLSSQGLDGMTTVNVTNTSPASATITVIAVTPPSLTKGFAPNTIFIGGFSRLTITLNNNDNDTNLTGTSYTDTLPAGLVLRNPVNATVTGCGVGSSLTATPGGNQIAISNATVTPSTNCIVAVDVTGASGLYTSGNGNPNTIPAGPGGPGSIQTNQGVTNGSPASADLTIQPVDIDKAFSLANFQAGGTTTLTITLRNPTGTPYTNVDISDTLPGAFVVNNFVSNTCGGTVTAIAGTNLISLDNGTIPASATPPTPATCVITVVVTSPVASSGTNTIPINNLSSPDHPGLTNITSATASITAYAVGVGLSGTKSFSLTTIDPGENTRLRIDLTAPADTNLTNFSITDDLSLLGLTITNSTPASKTANCIGGTLSAPTGGTIISWTGGTINAGQLCRIDVFVTSNTPGTITNRITPANISNFENRDPAADITANLTVRQPSDLSSSKAFYPTQVVANGISTLTITLQNTNAAPLTGVSVSDNLNTMGGGTNTVRIASAPNYSASTTCGGVLIATAATQLISLTGGTIPAQVLGVPGICTITVNVIAGTNTSTRTNTLPRLNVSGTIQGLGTIINPESDATATLQVLPLTIGVVKGFDPVLVYGTATSTMTVRLTNPNNATLVGIAFTDNMALLDTGIVLANPVDFDTGLCGGTLTGNPGDSSFSFSGGTLLPNSNCELTLRVVMQENGNRTNRIPAGAVTTLNGVSSPDPTEASLTNLPGLSINKVFNPDTILVGQPTTLTLTIENTSAISVVNMGVTDILPGALPFGLVIASPTNASTTCIDTDGTGGYSFTATAGTQQISLVGAEMGGSSSCVIVVDVTSDEPGVYINTIAAGAITSDGGITNNNPTSDTLTVNSNYSLGNRVWFDTDNSSAINGTEEGIDGVTVQLYAAVGGIPIGAVLATDTTTNDGYYRFDNLPAGDYVVVIPASQFLNGGPLAGYWSSGTTLGPTGSINEAVAPDPDTNIDSDDNGNRSALAGFAGAVISQAVTLDATPSEPITESDIESPNPPGEAVNNQSNLTVDFGFYRVEIGDQIFVDVNEDGDYDVGTDSPLANALVQLFASNGTTEIITGADGILGTADDGFGPDGISGNADDGNGGVITGPSGLYEFSGLPQGDYIVKVTPPAGYSSTIDTVNGADTTDPDVNANNNDNGNGTGSGQVSSGVLTMTPGQGTGGSVGAANNIVTNNLGTTSDPTVDFGFTTLLYSLGNRVWFDTDNDAAIEFGLTPESGTPGVRVELYNDDGDNVYEPGIDTLVSFTTTDANGYYRFDNLPAGNYIVVIPEDNFRDVGVGDTVPGDPLSGYWSSQTSMSAGGSISDSTSNDADADDDDSDDNGLSNITGANVNYVASAAVTLGPASDEPEFEGDAPLGQGTIDDRANMTVDFGFYRVELGNIVYLDVNNNGTYDAGDTPLQGATVQLFASNGTIEINVGPDGILGTADDGSGNVVTGVGGTYLFSGLPQGDYIVKVTPPVGYSSTNDAADNTDTTTPNTNADNNDNGVGQGVGQVSSNIVSLIPGSTGTPPNNNNIVNDLTGTTTNPTVDFGFVTNNGLTKLIVGTNETFTVGNDVAIGEIVTYEISINLPVGVALNNVTVTDQMDKGLAFVNCLSVVLGGTNITNPVCTPPAPAVSSITDPGDLSTNPANDGRQVVFTIGNIPAPTTATTLVIQYRAIVLDVIENQDGVSLNNNVTWAWTGGSFSTSAPNVNIVESDLAIDKSANPNSNVPVGTPIQFTLVIDHTTPQSQTDAFDVVVTDILPVTLAYVECSVQYTAGLAPDTLASTYCNPGSTTTDLIFEWAVFPLGQTSTITFFATLIGTPAVNDASVAWTSLPIDPQLSGLPVQLSIHNASSTERWYDPLDTVNIYSVSDSVSINSPTSGGGGNNSSANLPTTLPVTGFAPNKITSISQQPSNKAYTATDVWLEIPSLGVTMPIVGVPLIDEDWDVSWLWGQAGWLEGTAFPGWQGNSGLTGHVTLPNGEEGPFAALGNLSWGDRIIVHAYGSKYIYEVRKNSTISPYNMTVLGHEEDAWLTLLTCKNYNESTDTYSSRIAVRAILIEVKEDNSEFSFGNMR